MCTYITGGNINEVNKMTHTCNYQLDLDGQVTCVICGAMDDDMDARSKIGYFTGKWSDDDDFRITPFLGPNR